MANVLDNILKFLGSIPWWVWVILAVALLIMIFHKQFKKFLQTLAYLGLAAGLLALFPFLADVVAAIFGGIGAIWLARNKLFGKEVDSGTDPKEAAERANQNKEDNMDTLEEQPKEVYPQRNEVVGDYLNSEQFKQDTTDQAEDNIQEGIETGEIPATRIYKCQNLCDEVLSYHEDFDAESCYNQCEIMFRRPAKGV